MRPIRDKPIPIEEVRDLLGICRALYASKKSAGAGDLALKRISDAGRDLVLALELAASPERSLGHVAAWNRVARAVEQLKQAIDVTTPLAPLLEAAAKRIVGPR